MVTNPSTFIELDFAVYDRKIRELTAIFENVSIFDAKTIEVILDEEASQVVNKSHSKISTAKGTGMKTVYFTHSGEKYAELTKVNEFAIHEIEDPSPDDFGDYDVSLRTYEHESSLRILERLYNIQPYVFQEVYEAHDKLEAIVQGDPLPEQQLDWRLKPYSDFLNNK